MDLLENNLFSVSFLSSEVHLGSGNKSVLTLLKFWGFFNIWIHPCALILQQLTTI